MQEKWGWPGADLVRLGTAEATGGEPQVGLVEKEVLVVMMAVHEVHS